MHRYERGFTLVELMVAMALIAILASLGVPAFNQLLERNKVDTDLAILQSALSACRLEAINKSSDMALVRSGASWGGGLEVRLGSGANSSDVVRKLPAMAAGATVAVSVDNLSTIVFNSLGGLRSPANGVTFSYTRGAYSKTLSVCASGRVVVGNCS